MTQESTMFKEWELTREKEEDIKNRFLELISSKYLFSSGNFKIFDEKLSSNTLTYQLERWDTNYEKIEVSFLKCHPVFKSFQLKFHGKDLSVKELVSLAAEKIHESLIHLIHKTLIENIPSEKHIACAYAFNYDAFNYARQLSGMVDDRVLAIGGLQLITEINSWAEAERKLEVEPLFFKRESNFMVLVPKDTIGIYFYIDSVFFQDDVCHICYRTSINTVKITEGICPTLIEYVSPY